MAWKLGGGAGALLLLVLSGSYAQQADERERTAARNEYRRPDTIPFPDHNPYSPAKAELGRSLFFDPILSDTRTRSCASCHSPDLAWGDGRARAAKRDHGDMALRSPTLLNLAWADGPLGWDGKFGTLERVTRIRIEQALATFERTIVSGRSPFDDWVAGAEGAIDASAKRGFALFTGKANCAACHSGWAFTDGSFHDIGSGKADDIGRGRLFPNSVALRYAFKTPTLRDVAKRAPYMHDGSIASLGDVIDLYDRGGIERPSRSRDIRPLDLTSGEKADLLAFLQTLSTAEPQPVPAPFAQATTRP